LLRRNNRVLSGYAALVKVMPSDVSEPAHRVNQTGDNRD